MALLHNSTDNLSGLFAEFPLPFSTVPAAGLTYSEVMWAHVIKNVSHHTLVVYFTMFWSIIGYILNYLPFAILEQIPYFDKYKIQKGKKHSAMEYRDLYTQLFLSYVFVILPLTWLAYPLFTYVGVTTDVETLPTWFTFVLQITLCYLIEDTCHYFNHRLMHVSKWMYNNIHVMHHRWSAPIGLAAQYAHPLEIIILGFGTFLGPILLKPHVTVMWAWIFLRQWEAVVVHCGYDFPFALDHVFSFIGGTHFHDHHHRRNTGNFSSTFKHWDVIFGTDASYKRDCEKEAQLAKKKAN